MSLAILTGMSNRYGANNEYVLAGGGNTSFKEDGVMYVKGSGAQMSDILPDQFVAMDVNLLREMVSKEYPAEISDDEREEQALESMMAARLKGEEAKRPSVEAILHAVFPYKFVLHLHPALVNGLTCGKSGEQLCNKLFGDDAVWIKLTKPGLILAQVCQGVFDESTAKIGIFPRIVILQNHGIFYAIELVYDRIHRSKAFLRGT